MASITHLNREMRVLRRKNTALKQQIESLTQELNQTGRYTKRDIWVRVALIEFALIFIFIVFSSNFKDLI